MAKNKTLDPKVDPPQPTQPAPEQAGKPEQTMLQQACDACGIDPHCVFSHRVEGESVTIVTLGGSKLRWNAKSTAPAPKLTRVQITGTNPLAAERRVIAGKKRGK